MARCPQCAPEPNQAPLVHILLTEGLAGYSCGTCLGTLLSLVSYRAWRESAAGRQQRRATSAATPDVDAPDSIGAKKCPKCSSLMSKYRVTADQANRLDYCPHCEEIWLDNGEWQLVEGLVASGDFARVFTQSWQHAVRAGVTEAMADNRLREHLGPDHERVAQFADWLQSQPAKAEILAMLARPRGPAKKP